MSGVKTIHCSVDIADEVNIQLQHADLYVMTSLIRHSECSNAYHYENFETAGCMHY